MKIYIDFDGTLFDSYTQYKKFINVFNKYNIEEKCIQKLMNEESYKKEKSFDILATKIIYENNLNENIINEIDKIHTKDLVYKDVFPFLEKYSKKYNLILLTLGNIKYQQKKIKSSELSKYFKEIIITDKDKSKLNIDYNNGIFIDNSPIELEKFYNSNANNLIRIRRENDKYSKINLNINNIPEFKDFEELLKSNYIDKIGDVNYE